MATDLARRRVLRDVEVVARAGLDLEEFLEEALTSLQRAVPYVGGCVATVDPATLLLTGTYKFGDLLGRDEHDHEWGLLEYGQEDPTSFRDLARGTETAVVVSQVRTGVHGPSARMDDFMRPYFGYTDELRAIARDSSQVWGGLALFRDPTTGDFDEHDAAFVGSLAPTLSVGIRSGLLATSGRAVDAGGTGPAVIIIGADGEVRQFSHGAAERVADLLGTISTPEADGMITSLVGASRRFALGLEPLPPRARVRSRSGMWHVLHAAPMCARDGVGGDVVVTIDEARPPEIVPLVVAAFGLTQRERDVTQLVLQGLDTKEIATNLHLSTWTVQDHLKAVFGKAGVRSRRELIARIYFDQYVPRMRTEASDAWG